MVLAQADWVKMKFQCYSEGVRMPYHYHLMITIRSGNKVRWEWGRGNEEFWRLYQKKNNNHLFLCTCRWSIWRTGSWSRPVVQPLMEVMVIKILLKVRGTTGGIQNLEENQLEKNNKMRWEKKLVMGHVFDIPLVAHLVWSSSLKSKIVYRGVRSWKNQDKNLKLAGWHTYLSEISVALIAIDFLLYHNHT